MSKSSAATASKILPVSAWSKGPPQSSSSTPTPRSQSPAPSITSPPPSASHSRRPSALAQQAVSFKDGVGARSPVNTSKPGSSVTFGSIDDVSAPISSSPASVPPIKSEGIKSFGSLAASTHSTNPAINGKPPAPSTAPSVTAKSAAPTSSTAAHSKISKVDIRKLFQSPSTPSASSSQPPADTASPSSRPSQLPHTAPPSQPPHPPPPHHQQQQQQPHFGSYQPYGPPPSGLRPQQQNGTPGGGRPPPSPVYPRQVPNGNVNGRPTGPPPGPPTATTPMSATMPSPRLGTIPGQPPQMQPGQMQPGQMPPGAVPYPPYYYPYMPDYMYPPQWMPPPHVMPQTQQPPGPPGPHPGMSPRAPPPPLHTPGTPTLPPASLISAPGHPPHNAPSPHMHPNPLSSNITSPPATPSVPTGPRVATMDRNAPPFVPGGARPRQVVIKNPEGHEVQLESFKRHSGAFAPHSPIVAPGSPAKRNPVRIENPEEKMKKEAEEKEKQRKAAEEKLRKENEERRKKEEAERKKKEEAEKKQAEEREKERIRKENEEKEKERVRKEKEEEERKEKERIRKEEEEKERLRKEKEEEEERLRKEAEEQERLKKEAEEQERLRKEAEEKAKAEAEAAAAAAAAASSKPATIPEQVEEGEVDEDTTPKDEAKDKIAEKAPLRIDTTVHNHDSTPRRRPGPLDLTSTKTQAIAAPLPSALATARVIDDLDRISYPDGIQSPKPELNVNAKQGKFRYDRDFLLQFMAICKERPDSLPPLDAIGLEPSEQSYALARGGSGRRQQGNMGPPPSRQPSIGLGFKGGIGNSFNMGQFSTPGNKTNSNDDRFGMSSRSASMSGGPPGFPLGRPSPMVRSTSQGGPGMPSHRTRSKRGEKRGDPNKGGGGNQSSYNAAAAAAQAAAMNFEPVAPLEVSANRWVPTSGAKKAPAAEQNSPDLVDRKVKALLNKLTMEKFESISDQIIEWANKSESEKDGRTLIQVIRLVFEKATDEATWSEMYARLCRKMMERISSAVQDDSIKSHDGKAIAGGQLFRKYLLNRCQEDFERGWVQKEATAAAAATKASEDKAAAENNKDGEESALYSDEYYAAQKAKRQGLGLVKFIGELFKLQMLTERIMHECVKKLLSNVDNPEEEEIESLCKLLTTVGQLLDTAKAKAHMDVYFQRMKELTKSANVNSRMQFMLQDVIELRERKWIPRNQVAAPTTLAAVHEAAAKDRAANEKEANRNLSMSRGGSRRGGERGDYPQVGPDGWVTRPSTKAGDLSQFGKINKTNMMTLGPASVFVSKEKGKRESSIQRTSSNMFSMLNAEVAAEAVPSKSSRPPSRKASVDLGAGGAADVAPQRRKLNLLPRTKPLESKQDDSAVASAESDDDAVEHAAGTPSMSVDEAKKRIEEDCKEFFNVRDLNEAEVYFTKLPVEHRKLLIDKLVTIAIESSQGDADLVAGLFTRAAAGNLCSPATFEDGFVGIAEILDDLAIDVPKAFTLFATMMKGAGLDKDEERRNRLASKSMDSEKLLKLLLS